MFEAFWRWWKGEPPKRAVRVTLPPVIPATPAGDFVNPLRRGVPARVIEEQVRRAWRWNALPRERAEETLAEPDAPVEIIGVLSFHPNGYVREGAVRRLDSFDNGAELPFLLLRLADWVPQVRDAARPAVLRRMRPEFAPLLVQEFPLLTRAMRAERGDAAAITEALARVFATKEGKAAVRGAPSRAVAKFVIQQVPEAADAVVGSAFAAYDPVIRILVIPLIARAADALPSLQRLARDPFPSVRREALVVLAKAFPEEAKPLLDAAVFDRSAIVRHAASLLLGGDIAARYRAALDPADTPRRLAATIGGLAEFGVASDAESLAPFLTHDTAAVRRAAVKAVMRLADSRYLDRVVPMLRDDSPAVSAAVRDALRRRASALDMQSLLDDLRDATTAHARRNIVHVLAALPKWDAIAALLTAAAEEQEDAIALIKTWNACYNAAMAVPSRSQVERVVSALDRAAPRLDEHLAAELRFTLLPFTERG